MLMASAPCALRQPPSEEESKRGPGISEQFPIGHDLGLRSVLKGGPPFRVATIPVRDAVCESDLLLVRHESAMSI